MTANAEQSFLSNTLVWSFDFTVLINIDVGFDAHQQL